MDSSSSSNLINFLKEFRALECIRCGNVFGFQQRSTGHFFCTGGCHEDCGESIRLPGAGRSSATMVVPPSSTPDAQIARASSNGPAVKVALVASSERCTLANHAKLIQPKVDVVDGAPSPLVQSFLAAAPKEIIRPTPVAPIVARPVIPEARPVVASTSPILWSNCTYSPNISKEGALIKVQFMWNATSLLVIARTDEVALDDFQSRIRESMSTAKVISRPLLVDEMVIAPYEDDLYRARVINVQSGTCDLLFVDFGDKANCQVSDIRELNSTLAKEPIYGLTVHLDKTPKTPPENFQLGGLEDEIYSSVYVIDFCRKEPIVPNEMTAVEVRLWDEGKENTLNETIKKLISPGKPLIAKSIPAPLTPKRTLWTDCAYSPNLKQGSSVRVQFAWTMNHFQVVADKDETDLYNFQETLKAYANKKPLDRPPVENELVIAKYEEGDWYRGKVTKVEGSDCEVSFVDFGDKVKCAWSIVVPVDETIMKHPIYGLSVRMSKVPPPPALFKMSDTLTDAIYNNSYTLDLVDKDGPQAGGDNFEANLWCGEDTLNMSLRAAFKLASSIGRDMDSEEREELEHLAAINAYFRETKEIVEEAMRTRESESELEEPYVFRLDQSDYRYRIHDLPLMFSSLLTGVLEIEITKFRSLSRMVGVPVGKPFDQMRKTISENISYWMHPRISLGLCEKYSFTPAVNEVCLVKWPEWNDTSKWMDIRFGTNWMKDLEMDENNVIDISRQAYDKYSGKWFRAACKASYSYPRSSGCREEIPLVYEMFLVDLGITTIIPKGYVYAIPHRFMLTAQLSLCFSMQLDGITQFSDEVDKKWKCLLLPGMRIKGQIVWMVDEINIIRLIEPTESQFDDHYNHPRVQQSIANWNLLIKNHKRHLKVKKMSTLKGSYPKNMEKVLAKEAQELKLKPFRDEYSRMGMIHPDRVFELALPRHPSTKI